MDPGPVLLHVSRYINSEKLRKMMTPFLRAVAKDSYAALPAPKPACPRAATGR